LVEFEHAVPAELHVMHGPNVNAVCSDKL